MTKLQNLPTFGDIYLKILALLAFLPKLQVLEPYKLESIIGNTTQYRHTHTSFNDF